jgi:TRAP-type C4-dicarboxylate transport system permease small subunit
MPAGELFRESALGSQAMPSTSFLSKALTRMEKAIAWLATVIIAVMVVNILLGVFSRFVLHLGIPFTEELGRYLMIWGGYLGCVLALKEGSHISITAVVGLFPPAGRRIINFVSRLIVTVFLAVIVVTSFTHLRSLKIQKSSAMLIPMVIPYLSVTVGALLMAVVNIIRLLGHTNLETPPEAK